mgnify:CR=1 FL=1
MKKEKNFLLSIMKMEMKFFQKENEHLKQMQAYKSAYTTYFNKPTTAFLLYTDTVELIEVR